VLYLALILMAVFATAAMTKLFPRTRAHIALVSIGAGIVALAIAIPTGNLALFYGAAFLVGYGVLLLFVWVVMAAFKERSRRA